MKIYAVISLLLTISLSSISYIISFNYNNDLEKLSPYECGFNPFDDARQKFDISFYLIAILFLVFDLEICFLFPWAISLWSIGLFGYITLLIFLTLLTLGFIYEWYSGSLE